VLRSRISHLLDTTSPEALFVVSATSQYIGASIAVSLFDQVPPASVAWLRVIGAALALLAVSWRSVTQRWTRQELIAAAAFGIATTLMNVFFYLAIARLPLGKGVAIEFIGPIAVAAARTRSSRNAGALALAALGVAVLSGLELDNEPLGLVFIFLASAMWASYIIIGSHVARLDRGVAGLGVGLAIGALVATPIGAPGSGPAWVSPHLLALCLLVGVFSNAIGYGIDQHIMRRIPIRRFSVLLALLPVTATVIGFIALGQTPTIIDLAGMSLVLGGVIIQDRDTLTATVADTDVAATFGQHDPGHGTNAAT
jgi:inner membrane transporter RhtA